MSTSFNHVGQCVTDLDRSIRFYTELLGFEIERRLEVPDSPADRLVRVAAPLGLTAVYLRRDGLVLELLEFARPGNPFRDHPRVMNEPGLTHLSFTVAELPAVLPRVEELGGTVLADTDVSAAVFIRDPDGQLVELLAARAG